MAIEFSCPRCGTHFTVEEKLAGKKGRCKKCNHMMTVPAKAKEIPSVVASGLFRIGGTMPGLPGGGRPLVSQAQLAPVTADFVNPIVQADPDLVEDDDPGGDYDVGRDYELAKTDPRLRPVQRRKRNSSNLPDWMQEDQFQWLTPFFHKIGNLPYVYRGPLRWVLRALRNISDIAYLISIAFMLVILLGAILKNHNMAIIGAAGVVLPNLFRIAINAASFVALPFLAGPVKGVLFFIPPLTFYYLYKWWPRMKKATMRVVGPAIPIVGVVLAFAFVPQLSSGNVDQNASIAERIEAGRKTITEGIDEQLESRGVSVSGTVDDVIEKTKEGVQTAKEKLEEQGVPVDDTISDLKQRTQAGVESIKETAKEVLDEEPAGESNDSTK